MKFVSQACFCFLAQPKGEGFFLFFYISGKDRAFCGVFMAHWRNHSQVAQGREHPRSACSLCPLYHAKAAICEQCVKAKQTLDFPDGRVAFAFFSVKDQKGMVSQSFKSYQNTSILSNCFCLSPNKADFFFQ